MPLQALCNHNLGKVYSNKHEAQMTGPNEEVHISTEDARAGETPHIVRYVLGISMTLAVIALGCVWYFAS